jgi:retron-type reverse transcriptase
VPARHDNLFGQIAGFAPLLAAYRRAVKGKRRKPGAAAFAANLEGELLRLERQLRDGSWRPGRYVEIQLRDPKPRLVSAAPFRDRVVHHALCAVVEPIWDHGFIAHSYANRAGKGTHRAIAHYERLRDRHAHVLRCDLFRFFPAIDHAILKVDFRRRVVCPRTLWLMDEILDGSNPQEPVHLHYPGDDLLAPLTRRRGLPIGNLTSQFFANVHLDGLDHFCTEVLRAPYLRYVDDFALFHDDPAVLEDWRGRLAIWLGRRRLSLHPRKTRIQPSAEPAEFLGLVLAPSGRRLPEANVRRFRNRLRGLRDRWRTGTVTEAEVDRRVGAWIAHAAHADTWRLRQAIFRGGRFDSAAAGQGPSPREPGRPPPCASFAAAPGTTTQGTCARATATGTPPETETQMPASGSPARLHA